MNLRKHRLLAWTTLVLVWAGAFLLSGVNAAQVGLGGSASTGNGMLTVPVTIAPASQQSVAALQFDVHYDPNLYRFASAEAGDAAFVAGKDVTFSEPAPGTIRVMVAGFNQDALVAGTVTTLQFEPNEKTAAVNSTADAFSLSDIVVSDPVGNDAEPDAADPVSAQRDKASAQASSSSQTADAAAAGSSRNTAQTSASEGGPLARSGNYGNVTNGTPLRGDAEATEAGAQGSAAPAVAAAPSRAPAGAWTFAVPPATVTSSANSPAPPAGAESARSYTDDRVSLQTSSSAPAARRGGTESSKPMQLAALTSVPLRLGPPSSTPDPTRESDGGSRLGGSTDMVVCGIVLAGFFVFTLWALRKS